MLCITRQDITPVYKWTVLIHVQDFSSYIFDFAIYSRCLRSLFILFMSAILIVLESSCEEQRCQAPIKPIWTLKLDVRYIWVTLMLKLLRYDYLHGNKHGTNKMNTRKNIIIIIIIIIIFISIIIMFIIIIITVIIIIIIIVVITLLDDHISGIPICLNCSMDII